MLTSPSALRELLGQLCAMFRRQKLPKPSAILQEMLGERTEEEHATWNDKHRSQARDVTIQSLVDQITSPEELSPQAQETVRHLPPVVAAIPGVREQDPDLSVLEDLGGLKTHANEIHCEEPVGVLWALSRLCLEDQQLKAYFLHLKQRGLRDVHDWTTFKQDLIVPLRDCLLDVFGPLYAQATWRLALTASQLFRCDLIRFDPSQVYTRAGEFYHNCGIGRSITFSTSSGLPNPLERYGSAWCVERYGLDPADAATSALSLKHPFRESNFTQGVLDVTHQCERRYVWERHGTSSALKACYQAIPQKARDTFVEDAVGLLARCFAFDLIQIVELETFDSWMKRLTRNGPQSIMISFRGDESKRISHAVHLNFANAKAAHTTYQTLLGAAGALTTISALTGPGSLLSALFWGMLPAELWTYNKLDTAIFHRAASLDEAPLPGMRVIKHLGRLGSDDKERMRLAEKEIQRLLE